MGGDVYKPSCSVGFIFVEWLLICVQSQNEARLACPLVFLFFPWCRSVFSRSPSNMNLNGNMCYIFSALAHPGCSPWLKFLPLQGPGFLSLNTPSCKTASLSDPRRPGLPASDQPVPTRETGRLGFLVERGSPPCNKSLCLNVPSGVSCCLLEGTALSADQDKGSGGRCKAV